MLLVRFPMDFALKKVRFPLNFTPEKVRFPFSEQQ